MRVHMKTYKVYDSIRLGVDTAHGFGNQSPVGHEKTTDPKAAVTYRRSNHVPQTMVAAHLQAPAMIYQQPEQLHPDKQTN